MRKCCLNCKRWQGTKHSKWGDCHYICADLDPGILLNVNLFGWNLTVPFDPHDVKYFGGKLPLPMKLDKGVRVLLRTEQDIKFILSQYDAEIIGERTANVRLTYFQTRHDRKGCGYFD